MNSPVTGNSSRNYSSQEIGRTLFELGELHLTHSPAKAREYYSQALGSFEEIGAAPNAERTRAALNSLG
jgi:hypothetical protein